MNPRLAATRRSRTSHFLSRTRVTSSLGSGRSRPPPLSVRSARWYVACGNSFGRSVHPCTDLMHVAMRRRLCPSRPCTVARKADMAVGLRSMHTGTTTSPAHARACCPGVVSSLKGRRFRLLARRSARKVGSCRSSGCRAQQRRRFTPTTVAASTSLSTEQRAAAKPCAATQPSSPPLLALAAPSPVPTRGRESRLSGRADAKSRYPELTRGGPQRLVVLAPEVGGRWSDECQQFLCPTPAPCPTRPTTLARLCSPGLGTPLVECAFGMPCSAPSPAPRLESGPCRRCLVRQTRSRWVTCWTSR